MSKRIDLANRFEASLLAGNKIVQGDLYGTTRLDREVMAITRRVIASDRQDAALERRGLWLNRNADLNAIAESNAECTEIMPNSFYHSKAAYAAGRDMYESVLLLSSQYAREFMTVVPTLNGLAFRMLLVQNKELISVGKGELTFTDSFNEIAAGSCRVWLGRQRGERVSVPHRCDRAIASIAKYAVGTTNDGIIIEIPVEEKSTVMDDIFIPVTVWSKGKEVRIFELRALDEECSFNTFFTDILPVFKYRGKLTPAAAESQDDTTTRSTVARVAMLNKLWK